MPKDGILVAMETVAQLLSGHIQRFLKFIPSKS